MLDIRRGLLIGSLMAICALGLACGSAPEEGEAPAAAPEVAPAAAAALPPTEETAPDVLNSSPRHGEWVDVQLPGSDVPISTWVVYPERSDPAPVVLVIHEIYGLTDWIRGVADQFAAEGFIAVAPDLLSGMGPDGGGTASLGERDNVIATIRTLEPDERTRRLDAVRTYALDIPAGNGRLGSVGFCWGGGSSFAYAIDQPELDAAVVYYGSSPAEDAGYAQINAPVLGHYGGNDERVNSTIPRAEEAMAGGTSYEPIIYEGAGHGFLRAQLGQDGANMRATEQAWPRTVGSSGNTWGTSGQAEVSGLWALGFGPWAVRGQLAPRSAPTASTTQPAMRQSPPIGVIAPSQRMPVTASRYRLPEKTTIPATNSQPADPVQAFGQRDAAHATASNPSAWLR